MVFNEKAFLGKWQSEPDGNEDTTLEFKDGGLLEYTIHSPEKDQKILLTYRVEHNTLVTDQPSHPREERTPFSFTDDGKLVLTYRGQRSLYTKT